MMRLAAVLLAVMACNDKSNPKPATTPPPSAAGDAAAARSDDTAIADARALVGNLAAGKFGDVVKTFDATMTTALPEAQLATTWKAIEGQAGAFEAIDGARAEHVKGYVAVIVTCKFKLAKLDGRVVYDATGKVAGLRFTPAAAPYSDPPYVDRAKLTEREVTVGSGEWALPGT